jgi:hypothetical protein
METKSDKKLTPRQLKAIPFLAGAGSITDGCKAAGISRKRFYSWLGNPAFKEEFERGKNEVINRAKAKLFESIERAVETLVGLLADESGWLRRMAANDILSHALKMREAGEIEERLSSIERVVLKRKNGATGFLMGLYNI